MLNHYNLQKPVVLGLQLAHPRYQDRVLTNREVSSQKIQAAGPKTRMVAPSWSALRDIPMTLSTCITNMVFWMTRRWIRIPDFIWFYSLTMSTFIQWNIRGLQANKEELNILLSNFKPILVSLQETFLKPGKTATFKNYSLYNLPSEELPYYLIVQFHTVKSNLTLACRPLQSEPHATKLSLYVQSIYLHHPNLT